MRRQITAAILSLFAALPARADLAVVTDVAPVASLAAMVTGSGDIRALVGAGQDPHHMSLRPSDVRAVAAADLLVWIGPDATPWMAEVAKRANATSVTLPGALCAQDGTPTCPDHPWLDPVLMGRWLQVIAAAAGRADPQSGTLYLDRAVLWQSRLVGLDAALREVMASVAARPFLAEHDAFAAFVRRYGLTQAGALSDSEAEAPSVARRAQTERLLDQLGPVCLFSTEDPAGPAARQLVEQGRVVLTSVDILARGQAVGPQVYGDMMGQLAADLAGCLKAQGAE